MCLWAFKPILKIFEIIFERFLENMLFNLGLRLIDVIVTSIAGLFVLKFVLTLNLGVLKEFNIMKKFFLIKTLIFVTIVQNIIAGILLPKTEVAMKLLL